MIELLQEYWRPFLYSDGNHITGLAMTLWLLSAALIIGFVLSIPLSIARVSSRRWIRWPVQFYTYVFRGTPLYIQLLICYTGIYSIAAIIYLCVTFILVGLFRLAERRWLAFLGPAH